MRTNKIHEDEDGTEDDAIHEHDDKKKTSPEDDAIHEDGSQLKNCEDEANS